MNSECWLITHSPANHTLRLHCSAVSPASPGLLTVGLSLPAVPDCSSVVSETLQPFSLLIPSFLHHLLYIQDFVVKFCLGAEKEELPLKTSIIARETYYCATCWFITFSFATFPCLWDEEATNDFCIVIAQESLSLTICQLVTGTELLIKRWGSLQLEWVSVFWKVTNETILCM